jgi:hypothetical protein
MRTLGWSNVATFPTISSGLTDEDMWQQGVEVHRKEWMRFHTSLDGPSSAGLRSPVKDLAGSSSPAEQDPAALLSGSGSTSLTTTARHSALTSEDVDSTGVAVTCAAGVKTPTMPELTTYSNDRFNGVALANSKRTPRRRGDGVNITKAIALKLSSENREGRHIDSCVSAQNSSWPLG